MIKVENLHIAFENNQVLKGLFLTINESDTLVIVGISGIGKSVLLKCIAGLLKPSRGQIYIDEQEVIHASKNDLLRIRKKIGMLFQEGALFDSMTVFENVAFPLVYHKVYSKKEIDNKVHEYIEIVEMRDFLNAFPNELSGGMKRKVALARAMILEPKYLFYDEPTSGLDPSSAAVVESMILKLKREMCITSLIVTHDIELSRYVGEKIALLEEGIIVAIQEKEKAFKNDSLIYKHFIEKRERIRIANGS